MYPRAALIIVKRIPGDSIHPTLYFKFWPWSFHSIASFVRCISRYTKPSSNSFHIQTPTQRSKRKAVESCVLRAHSTGRYKNLYAKFTAAWTGMLWRTLRQKYFVVHTYHEVSELAHQLHPKHQRILLIDLEGASNNKNLQKVLVAPIYRESEHLALVCYRRPSRLCHENSRSPSWNLYWSSWPYTDKSLQIRYEA